MFRRKDEAYDTNDLLQDVMSGLDDDELLEPDTSETTNKAANAMTPSETSSNDNDQAEMNTEPVAAKPAAPAAAPAAKPAPAAAFRPAAPAAARNVPAAMPERNAPAAANPKASKRVLTVGHDIHMEGKISTCDRLVIEGSVDASLSDVHTVEIAQTGSFKGNAEIEDAEISGTFDGDLIVNGRLTIYASGKVSGNVSYGEIEIERGGKLTGAIKTADEVKASQQQPMKKAA